MSAFLACVIALTAFLAGLLVVMSEQIRVAFRRRVSTAENERASCGTESAGPQFTVRQATSLPQNAVNGRVSSAAAQARVRVYRQVLDRLGDDLDQDIAEWEAVLQEFPQDLFSGDVSTSEVPDLELNDIERQQSAAPIDDQMTEPLRSRRVDSEEHAMIVRLSNTGFAPEEIALWLNLPVERVHEVLSRP